MSVCITGDVNLHHLAQMLSAKILYYKFTIFSFVISKYLGRDTLRLCLNFYPLILAFIHFSCLLAVIYCGVLMVIFIFASFFLHLLTGIFC